LWGCNYTSLRNMYGRFGSGPASDHPECPGPRGRRARPGRRNTYFSGSERHRKRPSTQTAPAAPQTQTDAAGRVAGPGRGDFRGRASGLEGSTNVRTRGAQPQSGAQGAGPVTRSKARPRHPARVKETKAAPQTTRHAPEEQSKKGYKPPEGGPQHCTTTSLNHAFFNNRQPIRNTP